MSFQITDSYVQIKPRFSVGRELATFITSCGILHRAWEQIYNISKKHVDFFLNEDEDVAYVTFPSFCREDFRHREYDIQNEEIFSVCLRGNDDEPALVHKGAFNRFQRVLESSDFEAKMEGLRARAIMFVGHSMGGAVATLATLWYLQNKARHKSSCFCITFGSPLVGNAILGKAIEREGWTEKFVHVVSKYDFIPRVLLAPFESIFEPLNVLVPHWSSIMGTPYVAVTRLSIPEARENLLEKVLQCTSMVADNTGEYGLRNPYRPFGTYMFCSTQGAACIDDSEAVLKMLHFTMQGLPFNQLAAACAASDHIGYGQMLEVITKDLVNEWPIANFAGDSFDMGIAQELQAMAVGSQEMSLQ